MTNPAERAALDRLNQLAGAGGQHERTQGDFRSTVSQYLSETVPVLTHPRVATSLLDLTGDINMFDIAHITASPLLSKIDELLTTRSKPVRRLNPLWGIDDKKSENFRLGFCLYKCTDEVQTYQIGVKVEAERVKHRSNTQNDPVQYDLNTILTTFFPSERNDNITSFTKTVWANTENPISHPDDLIKRTALVRPIDVDDFIRYPEFFPIFKEGINTSIEKATELLTSKIWFMESHIAKKVLQDTVVSTIPGASVNLPQNQALTETQIESIVHQALAQNPRILRLEQEGATKQDLQAMLTALMETTARDTTRPHNSAELQQAYAQLRQVAYGNHHAQQAVEAFITNSVNLKDPGRVYKTVLKIVGGFVPGAQGVVALLEALNEWTRP